MFQKAIVRTPCPEMIHGITTAGLGVPDFEKALEQHARYVEDLRTCGLDVLVLDADRRYPDSTFIEDVALCTSQSAIVTNPGAPSRNGEKIEIESVLRSFYNTVEAIESPGTLDAGDVMMVGRHFYIGISERTNQEGAEQLMRTLTNHQMTGSKIPLNKVLHLKSSVSYLEKNNMLVSGEFVHHAAFKNYNRIVVDPGEAYAANSLWINGNVLVPTGFPETANKIQEAGYRTISIDVSEFQKLDGGLSCLSLRF